MSLYRIVHNEPIKAEKTVWPASLAEWLSEELLTRDDLLKERFLPVGTWDAPDGASGILALDEHGDIVVVLVSQDPPSPESITEAAELAWDLRYALFDDVNASAREYCATLGRCFSDIATMHASFFTLAEPRKPAQFNHTQRVVVVAPDFPRDTIETMRLHRLETQIDGYAIAFIDLEGEGGLISVESINTLEGGRIASLVSLVIKAPSAVADRLFPQPKKSTAGAAGREQSRILTRMTAIPNAYAYGVLAAMMLVYAATFSFLTVRLHNNFGTYGFDLGVFDQGIWLLSRFKDLFVTVRGLNLFGDHLSFILVFVAPLYWLWDDVRIVLILQTIVLAIGAVPVFLIANERLKSRLLSLAFAASYLLYPALQWLNRDHFHPESLATPSLLFAFYFAITKRYLPFTIFTILAMLTKEDVALVVVALGIYLMLTTNRKVGAATTLLALGWFIVEIWAILPQFNRTGLFRLQYYSHLGSSYSEVIINSLTKPELVFSIITEQKKLVYILQLLVPVAFFPLAAIEAFLVTLPALFSNLTSQQGYTAQIEYHYTATIIPFVFVASILAIQRLKLTQKERVLVAGLILAVAVTSNYFWSPSPISKKYHQGFWVIENPKRSTMERAIKLIPKNARVSAIYNIVPHLTHREYIYEFPNPFRAVNWGIRGENPADPDSIEYIVINTSYLSDEDRALVKRLQTTDFREIFNEADIVVLKRKM